jgi:hypothetical protein
VGSPESEEVYRFGQPTTRLDRFVCADCPLAAQQHDVGSVEKALAPV